MDFIIDWLTQPFSLGLLQNALKEMVLISVLAGIVGTFVVLRGIAFIVDGLSHAILPGIAVAFIFQGNLFWGALVAGVIVTALINLTSRSEYISEDSAIGIFFTGAFAIGVIIITKIETNGRNLNDILFGQLFAVQDQDIWQTLIISGLLVLMIVVVGRQLLFSSFDPTMAQAVGYSTFWLDTALYLAVALTVVVSLPAVGNILVLAFLITPAATARLLTDRFYPMIGLATGIALFTSLTGMYISYYAGIAGGGATIVVTGTVIFLLTLALSPRYGALGWWLNRRRNPSPA